MFTLHYITTWYVQYTTFIYYTLVSHSHRLWKAYKHNYKTIKAAKNVQFHRDHTETIKKKQIKPNLMLPQTHHLQAWDKCQVFSVAHISGRMQFQRAGAMSEETCFVYPIRCHFMERHLTLPLPEHNRWAGMVEDTQSLRYPGHISIDIRNTVEEDNI